MIEQVWWHVARASGLVAWGLCTLSVLWGLAASARLFGRRPAPNWLLDLHRFLGGLATVFVIVHLLALVADSYVSFGPAELLVPMASAWKPGPVAWGVVAFYLLVAVEVTSLARRRLSARLWRATHVASFPLWAAATVHTLLAGTDASHPGVVLASTLSFAAVLFATLVRFLSPRRAGRTAGPRVVPTQDSQPGPAGVETVLTPSQDLPAGQASRSGAASTGTAAERATAARAALAARQAAAEVRTGE